VWEFQGNLGLNFDLGRESMALESGNTASNDLASPSLFFIPSDTALDSTLC